MISNGKIKDHFFKCLDEFEEVHISFQFPTDFRMVRDRIEILHHREKAYLHRLVWSLRFQRIGYSTIAAE